MYRGKVVKVDTKGVYVQIAEFGTLGPCQYVCAKPAVGDMVIVADAGDDVSPDLVVLSGIGRVAIDESGNISLPGSIYSTADGAYSVDLRLSAGASGQNAAVFLLTNNYKRWFVGKESTAESGSNAGSNFRIWRYNDDGTSIGQALGINRATGRVTIDNVGATAGIEFGSGGPTITTGTGAPSHSAPNGSVYLRTDGTASTTLYVRAGGAWTALS